MILAAVLKALKGTSVVAQGPPGVGVLRWLALEKFGGRHLWLEAGHREGAPNCSQPNIWIRGWDPEVRAMAQKEKISRERRKSRRGSGRLPGTGGSLFMCCMLLVKANEKAYYWQVSEVLVNLQQLQKTKQKDTTRGKEATIPIYLS